MRKSWTQRLRLPWRVLAIVLVLVIVATLVTPRRDPFVTAEGCDVPDNLSRVHNLGIAVYDLNDSGEEKAGVQASSSRAADDLLRTLRPTFSSVVRVPAEIFEASVRSCTMQTPSEQLKFPGTLIGACSQLTGLMATLHLDALLAVREQGWWKFPEPVSLVMNGSTAAGPAILLDGTLVFSDGSKPWREWVKTGAGIRSGMAGSRALALKVFVDELMGKRREECFPLLDPPNAHG